MRLGSNFSHTKQKQTPAGRFQDEGFDSQGACAAPMVAAALPFCFAAKVGAAISCGNRKNAGSDVQSTKLPWSGAAFVSTGKPFTPAPVQIPPGCQNKNRRPMGVFMMKDLTRGARGALVVGGRNSPPDCSSVPPLFKSLPDAKTKTDARWASVFVLAGDEGFEPSQTESESVVLPLHKSPIFTLVAVFCNGYYYSRGVLNCQGYFLKNRGKLYIFSSAEFSAGKKARRFREVFVRQ